MTRLERVIARVLIPLSTCSGCGRPWFSDKRRVCRCGSSARTVGFGLSDGVTTHDRVS